MISSLRLVLNTFLCALFFGVAGCASAAPAPDKVSSSINYSGAGSATVHDASLDANADKSWSSSAQEVLMNALSLTGVRYKFGGNSPETGFDCSGFVRYVFQQAMNLTLPHGARAISQLGESVAIGDLKPGDLVFFNTLRSTFSHVGIYLGNNRFIHAPSSGGGIHVVDMKESYWAKRFNGARRIDTANITAIKASVRTE